MNVLLVSQCSKGALVETRRILDQFAERRGERTWQTPITQAGLDTLRRLLRQTARKNTAVACHWIRGKNHSELLWIVGDARRFNAAGAVPTNTTRRNILKTGDENDWHRGEDIRLLAQLAALLHDLGKASRAFQARLRGRDVGPNLYRHEWVSLRLFQAFVGQDGDEAWLTRLAAPATWDQDTWTAPGRYGRDGLDAPAPTPFPHLPPLAAALAWLILSHHRLPLIPVKDPEGQQRWLGCRAPHFNRLWLEKPLALVTHAWNEGEKAAPAKQITPFWQPAAPLPVLSPAWQAQAARIAKGLLARLPLWQTPWLENPYVLHLARLSLMLADHHYSSLPSEPRQSPPAPKALYANTSGPGELKQELAEHLLGVAREAGLIAHALPGVARHLPRLARHRGLRKPSPNPRFAWQNKAAEAARSLGEKALDQGAFIINMASTGCGKTLANARILYALADPGLGLRATFALGLRTLTLQTGRAYGQDLHLAEDELAVLVGGSANRALFNYYQARQEARGAASAQALLEEDSHVLYSGDTGNHPLLARALKDPAIRQLIAAPLLVCTVDHLIPASDSLRGGRQIAPMLRLMSGDLVLDELDDYDLQDLPALTRLVHLAGMLGTRVLLSSATLPPDLVQGMFAAYRAGRAIYRANRGHPGTPPDIPCLWVDEFSCQPPACLGEEDFSRAHEAFVAHRVTQLQKAPPLRRAALLPLDLPLGKEEALYPAFAEKVRLACLDLHRSQGEKDALSGKRVSFGLVRLANIGPLFQVAQALITQGAPAGVRIHLCVYHARLPLIQRSALENLLDGVLDRRDQTPGGGLGHPAIRAALDLHPEPDQLFIVLASPVCEVGRDWDGDWALGEPSSLRALIQLAGRVQRHRCREPDQPNVLIFNTNLRHFRRRGQDQPAFLRPGFESTAPDQSRFRLTSHWLHDLLRPEEYQALSAIPRIQPPPQPWQPQQYWVDLEQARIRAAMAPRPRENAPAISRYLPPVPPLERDEAASAWVYPQAALTGVLPQQQPFREETEPHTTLVFLPDGEDRLQLHRMEKDGQAPGHPLYVPVDASLRHDLNLVPGPGITPWGSFDLLTLLREQAEFLDLSLDTCARRFTTVDVPESPQGWRYHPWLGFTP
ncbi:type I-F CRISPR-associated helicase Cas3f [Azospira inquinata]|uniref:Type I-F CRISPR-associated helicase Cas3 n=1 Tax=Azospira inquinata TaxID=2785627 RepID=A0A975SLY2_9RHOO|nr:type I-F CRISPR-associated helicase Cas3f [Azospira inquinata]QWT45902.1 type I-F CRISPR-associated helicase Cas3 [Azospira inquinata]QWT48772.1 type I-F CRISPR-associated helicase Cas3 [Azospira inquinata]